MNKWIFLMLFLMMLSCSTLPPIEIPVDPTFGWDAVTTDCTGATITGTITYNVYVIAAPGPIPTISTPISEIPCGSKQIIDKTKINPLNTVPITTTTFKSNLTEGSYLWAVEATNASGTQGIIAFGSPFTVKSRPNAATNGTVGP